MLKTKYAWYIYNIGREESKKGQGSQLSCLEAELMMIGQPEESHDQTEVTMVPDSGLLLSSLEEATDHRNSRRMMIMTHPLAICYHTPPQTNAMTTNLRIGCCLYLPNCRVDESEGRINCSSSFLHHFLL